MCNLWPEATQEQKEEGWKLDFHFLEKVERQMIEVDESHGFNMDLESIEACLIAAALAKNKMCKGE